MIQIFYITKSNFVSSFQEKFLMGINDLNVYSSYTYRPKVSPRARILEKFCVVSFLQPLQKSEHAIFDT